MHVESGVTMLKLVTRPAPSGNSSQINHITLMLLVDVRVCQATPIGAPQRDTKNDTLVVILSMRWCEVISM